LSHDQERRATWLIASRNRGKIAELIPLLSAAGIDAIGLDDAGVAYDVAEEEIECFDSFAANSLAKARYFSARTGRMTLADDSGLCIDALLGLPGVRSRRFARDVAFRARPGASEDAANNDAMLDACWNSGWAPPWSAHFVCVAALVDGEFEYSATGRCDGVIIPEAVGAGGFGYDPYFVSTELGVSFAAASIAAKALISHRARAVAAVLAQRDLADSGASGR
jgi:XTP/dITP diphosphohydrolase